MNAISTLTNTPTMTSMEIAELTGKEHRNVMRDIRAMLVELHGEGGVLSFEHTHTNPQNGLSYPAFNLPKRETLILVSGYSVKMRARIIDRWQELESKNSSPAVPDFANPVEAARAWADQYEARLLAESTKAQIGSRREATAMNTASQAVKMIAIAWIFALPQHIAILMVNHIDDLTRRAAIAKAEGRDRG